MTNIRYVSALCSQKVLDYVFETSREKPQLAAQKFHRLLSQGFALHKEYCSIETLSAIPVVPQNHSRKLWNLASESINNLVYNYVPMLNVMVIKNVGVFLYTFFNTFFWSLVSKRISKKVILCDALNLSITAAALLASKLTFTKTIAIVTDIPGLMVVEKEVKMSYKGKLYSKLVSFMFSKFSGYVLLTEQMNAVVNYKNRPYMIMEGLVDIGMKSTANELGGKAQEKIVIYAGGLYEKYGVKTLIHAFMKLEDPMVRLYLYGSGDMVNDIKMYSQKDSRVLYLGLVPNEQVVKDQLRATLLVNPRPSREEFTKFSFPSKNMEYMASGTPMVTTKLPGMPVEYHDYIFLFEDETADGMHKTLKTILCHSKRDLHQLGDRAKAFVLNKKNNEIQAERILHFVNDSFFPT